MTKSQPLQPNRKLDITAPHDILNLELGKFSVKPELLDNTRILARGETRVVFGFGASDDHFAGCENECGRFGFADAHDDGGESLFMLVGYMEGEQVEWRSGGDRGVGGERSRGQVRRRGRKQYGRGRKPVMGSGRFYRQAEWKRETRPRVRGKGTVKVEKHSTVPSMMRGEVGARQGEKWGGIRGTMTDTRSEKGGR